MTDFLTGPWSLDLFTAVNLVLVAAAYLAGVRVRARRGALPAWPWYRTLSFLSALVLLAAVYLGPVAGWSHTFFWAHMAQHLVVMMAAAPLIVLGAPLLLLQEAVPDDARRRWVDPVLSSRAVRWLTDPLVTWLLFAGVLLGVHFTGFYDWAMGDHDAEMFIQRPLMLAVAILYYLPLIGSNPLPRRPSPAVKLISLGAMMVPEAIVGAVIYFSPFVIYATFANSTRPFGPDALTDQQLSGAVMWALVMVIDTMWMMVVATEWFSAEEEKARRMDGEMAAEQRAPA